MANLEILKDVHGNIVTESFFIKQQTAGLHQLSILWSIPGSSFSVEGM